MKVKSNVAGKYFMQHVKDIMSLQQQIKSILFRQRAKTLKFNTRFKCKGLQRHRKLSMPRVKLFLGQKSDLEKHTQKAQWRNPEPWETQG